MDGGEKSERVIALALTDPECGKVFGSSESDDSAVLSLTRLSTHGHFGQPRCFWVRRCSWPFRPATRCPPCSFVICFCL
jgi:hypothetical protein